MMNISQLAKTAPNETVEKVKEHLNEDLLDLIDAKARLAKLNGED